MLKIYSWECMLGFTVSGYQNVQDDRSLNWWAAFYRERCRGNPALTTVVTPVQAMNFCLFMDLYADVYHRS